MSSLFRELWEVVRDGKILATFGDEQEAKMYAACRFTGSEVVRRRETLEVSKCQ